MGDTGLVRATITDQHGYAGVRFTPSVVGLSTVSAHPDGLEGVSATFSSQAEPPVYESGLFFQHAYYLDEVESTGSRGPSRLVLYDDSTFVLQFDSTGYPYIGPYSSVEDGRLEFRFRDDGRWRAWGEMWADSMVVRYNDFMSGTDFDAAVFVRFDPAITNPGEP